MKVHPMSQTHPLLKPIIPYDWSNERQQDTVWMLSLYGTAIGAGTLFLPIDAGLNGIWPLIIMTLLAFPMTYFSHQALCRFVLSSAQARNNITDVVKEHFGEFPGKLITVLYFFSIYPILLMYGVAITNTVQSFIVHQMGLTAPHRAVLSFILLFALMSLIRLGQRIIIKAMSLLVYPFLTILITLSIYLIPHWNTAVLYQNTNMNPIQHPQSLLMTLWMLIPVMVFSFNHSPIISSFTVYQKQNYLDRADEKCSRILKYSHIMMVVTVLFFVFSCVFSLSPTDLALAKLQNISILSYLANHFHTPTIAYIAPFIAVIAISKSFLGHYLGASEGLQGLLTKSLNSYGPHVHHKTLQYGIDGFVFLTCWTVATINPNILNMIETLGGPIIAMILFLMPMYAMAAVPAMKKYRALSRDVFTTMIGFIAISAIIYGLWRNM
jgi:serine transporter